MATKKQIAANRKNAKKSTGPKTAKGKARSSRNALKHGLLSRQVVLADEDGEAFAVGVGDGGIELDQRLALAHAAAVLDMDGADDADLERLHDFQEKRFPIACRPRQFGLHVNRSPHIELASLQIVGAVQQG